jgi:glutathione synthase/RimK-type ligase-like ATP-grasp enzyme
MVTLGYAKCSQPSALAIAAASEGKIVAKRSSLCDINWGRSGITAAETLNRDISTVTNKRLMREAFKSHNVPMPALLSDVDITDWRDCRSGYFAIVGRPDRHTHGRGFWKIETEAQLDRALRGTRTKRAATHFMEYIDAVHELRVHVFQGKSIRMSEKHIEGAVGNWKQYTTIKPTIDKPTRRKARKAAKQAVEALGLDFGAVDILVDEHNNVYVLEVNSAPGIGGTLPALYAKTFIEWEETRNG